jgi:hypothetical protein
MKRHAVAAGVGSLILIFGLAWFVWTLLTPSSNIMDLTPQERRGYPQTDNVSASTTASSTLSCDEFTLYTCPLDRWQTFAHPSGFEFKYPLPENLKSTGDEVRIDLGYPGIMRFKLTILPMGLAEATRKLPENDLYLRFGGERKAVTAGGHRGLTVNDAEDAPFGWLTYIELDDTRTISVVAEFTEDFDSDQRLYRDILGTFKFD